MTMRGQIDQARRNLSHRRRLRTRALLLFPLLHLRRLYPPLRRSLHLYPPLRPRLLLLLLLLLHLQRLQRHRPLDHLPLLPS